MQAQQHVDGEKRFVQPNVDYSPWSPIDVIDYPLDAKINKPRAIQSETAAENVNSSNRRSNKFPHAGNAAVKSATRRNFESHLNDDQKVEKSSTTFRPAYKRRTFSTSASTTSTTNKPIESAAGRFKSYRRPGEAVSTTAKPKRQFTTRATSDNVSATTVTTPSSARVVFKKPTRGTYRPKTAVKSNANDDGNLTGGDGENYPEHFKALLKNKEVITQESDKSVLKKPSTKPFRQQFSTENAPKSSSVKIKPNAALYKPRPNRLTQKAESTTTTLAYSSTTESTRRPATLRTRSPQARTTERTRVKFTLPEPPTAKATPTQSTRTPVENQIIEEESMNVNTQITDDSVKQIDPPQDSLPRTSAVS